jgi:hypothetical protein
MNFKKIASFALTALALNLGIVADVKAATTSVKCEVRSGRAKISVDGAGLGNALYRAKVKSGIAAAVFSKIPSTRPVRVQRPIGGQVEFDFDSNPADVRAGATAIPSTFIKNRNVVGSIYIINTNGIPVRLVGSVASVCKVK